MTKEDDKGDNGDDDDDYDNDDVKDALITYVLTFKHPYSFLFQFVDAIAPLLKGNQKLLTDFTTFFPDLPPPPR